MRTFDPERLLGALEITEKAAEKGLWNQQEWIVRWECGTGGCLAGNYALSQGCVPLFDAGYDDTHTVLGLDGTPVGVGTWAAEDLGLTEAQSNRLFSELNTLNDLRRIVAQIIAEHSADAARQK